MAAIISWVEQLAVAELTAFSKVSG
jgi:hypothetical protein